MTALIPDDKIRLQQLIAGYMVSQVIHVAVTLGLPDLLETGEASAQALAKVTGTHDPIIGAPSTRALAACGLVRRTAAGMSQTDRAFGALLRAGSCSRIVAQPRLGARRRNDVAVVGRPASRRSAPERTPSSTYSACAVFEHASLHPEFAPAVRSLRRLHGGPDARIDRRHPRRPTISLSIPKHRGCRRRQRSPSRARSLSRLRQRSAPYSTPHPE